MLGQAIALAAISGTVFIVVLLALDRFERESLSRLFGILALAVAATELFGIAKSYLWPEDALGDIGKAFVEAALLEESLKLALLLLVIRRFRREINEPFDLVLYAGLIGLGFAVEENVGYFVKYRQDLAEVFAFRSLVPGHLLFACLSGGMAALGWARERLEGFLAAGWLVAILAHGSWNLMAFRGARTTSLGAYALVLFAFSAFAVARASRASPYRQSQARWRGAISASLRALAQRAEEPDAGGALRRELEAAALQIRKLPRLEGPVQDEIGADLAMAFPEPPGGAWTDPRRNALRAALGRLETAEAPTIDWSYYLLVALALLVSGAGLSLGLALARIGLAL